MFGRKEKKKKGKKGKQIEWNGFSFFFLLFFSKRATQRLGDRKG